MKWQIFKQWLSATDRFYTVPLFFSLTVFLLLHLIFFSLVGILPAKLPLFYSLPWGEPQLASKQQFLILPTVVLLISALNIAFAWRLHPSQVILRRMLFLTMVGIDLIILVAGIKIISIFL